MIGAGLLAQSMHSNTMRNDLLDDRSKALASSAKEPMTADKAKKVAKEFESLFISQMLEHMFGESSGEEAFGGAESDDIYKSMMVEQYGKAISKSGGMGIAAHIERSLMNRALIATQEV